MASIERLLKLDKWDAAEVAVESLCVVPMHPSEGREFKAFDRYPGSWPGRPANQFGLAVPECCVVRGTIVRVADGSDGGCRANLCAAFAVANRRKLFARIAVTPHIFVVAAPRLADHLDHI